MLGAIAETATAGTMPLLYRWALYGIASLWRATYSVSQPASASADAKRYAAMSFSLNNETGPVALQDRVQRSTTMTPKAMTNAIGHRSFLLWDSAAKARIVRLIDSGAFTDAALALVELEAPDWNLRSLLYDAAWQLGKSGQSPSRRSAPHGVILFAAIISADTRSSTWCALPACDPNGMGQQKARILSLLQGSQS